MTRFRLASGVLVSALVSGVLLALPGAPASAAPTDCPTAYPTADVLPGLTGTGYTVETGTTPAQFSATVLGTITDGIAPGIDMIMADLDSPALTRAGGVWAGMSGSPVYTSDGRLLGSVSYGLAASSPIAGITPAADLLNLVTPIAVPLSGSARIKVSGAQAAVLAGTGDATPAQASGGFRQLPMPVSVSGASAGSSPFLKKLTANAGVLVRTGAPSIPQAASSPSEIVAGGNFAAALSYGDVSISAVGTTTFVCDGQAVAFGHPFFDFGDVQYTAHPATAVYVQPDPVNGPFKVANPGGPVGVIDQDVTVGLHTELGATPATAFSVTSSLAPDGGPAVTGSTTGVYQPWAGSIAALHLQANIVKALGYEGPGSAALKFVVKGTESNGKTFTLTRSDHYSADDDISLTPAGDLLGIVDALAAQPFDALRITSVQVTGTVSRVQKQYRVTAVKVKNAKGAWVNQKGTLRAAAGRSVALRLTLARYRSSTTVTVPLTITIPAGTQDDDGELTVTDGMDANGDPHDATSLAGLLTQLTGLPTNDSVAGSLSLDGRKRVSTVTLKRTDAAVSPYEKDITVEVVR